MDLALVSLPLVAYVHAGFPLIRLWLGCRLSSRAVPPEYLTSVTLGSTDGTADVARRYADRGVVLFEATRCGGKNDVDDRTVSERGKCGSCS
jgi:hypothetical protein